jgi:hypothetical protein
MTLPTAPSFMQVKPIVPVPQQTSKRSVSSGFGETSRTFSTTIA